MLDNSNDNGGMPPAPSVDPRGQAALLLVESLIHGLIARSLMSADEAVEIVDVASEVELDRLIDAGAAHPIAPNTLTLLAAIRESLAVDAETGE